MTENEVLFQISYLVNNSVSFPEAVDQIAALLEEEAGGKGVFLDDSGAAQALDSFDRNCRSRYTVDLRDSGERLGQITLCFASDVRLGDVPRRLSEFVGEQLGMLHARMLLVERCSQLKKEIAQIEEDLATRKILQRAEGILISTRGMTPAAAKRWIAQQSEKTGLSKQDVGDRIIAYYLATGLREQRIA